MDSNKTMEIYQHYGYAEDYAKAKSGEYEYVVFAIGKAEDIEELTANMCGFGTKESQRIIIEFDKEYGYFMVKKIPMKYGASEDTP